MMGRSQSKRSNRKNTAKDFSNTNPVAKNMEKFNKPATHVDKKKESKNKGLDVDKAWLDDEIR
jgi:hypothetical protein